MQKVLLPVLQLYKREEQNFVLSNEIDNMALIMPSQSKPVTVSQTDGTAETKKRASEYVTGVQMQRVFLI